ncbi:MAG: cob(I)yrinic acid a,c-diamide adenosyltransferase [Gemmatimonadetes bacterium]|jgi:cob(I)alamin adenosyltransferase|nr:cob(I)yrinic acid a,c-diamide adenosyltransferase [Gemmatimonadota bacterium]
MVTLSRIYTRTGDGGSTRLGDNSPVSKTDPRVEAFGEVDELNAVLGLAVNAGLKGENEGLVQRIQNDLFDLGADLCKPLVEGEEEGESLRVSSEQVKGLEEAIDGINSGLETLKSFVLPGGSTGASWLHLARAVCRRGERQVWRLAEREPVNEQVLVFLNRLSDLFFVMARAENEDGTRDVLWQPGKGRESSGRPK